MDKDNRAVGAGLALVGFIIALVIMMGQGLTLNSLPVMALSGAGLLLSIIGGVMVYDFTLDNVSKKFSIAGSMALIVGLIIVLLLPFTSSAFGDVAGYGAMTPEEEPDEPTSPSFMRGNVVDAMTDPETVISGADIRFYDVEPSDGAQNTLYTDNTDTSGSFMTEIEEYAGTSLWVTAHSSGYYAEKDKGETGATGSKATNLQFDEYGKGLTAVGTFSKRLTNADNPDNIQIDGSGNIEIDNSEADEFQFDIVIETSASETALRNLLFEIEEAAAYDSESVELEVVEAEDPSYGTLDYSVPSGKEAWTSDITETEYQFDGDLEYNQDIVIRVTIDTSASAEGNLVEFEDVDDLEGGVGLEGETGISQESWYIETVASLS